MIHLGVCYGHNATVAVIKDGKLIFCQSEERLNRIKNSTGFPEQTLRYVYENIASREEIKSATLFQRSVLGYLTLKAHGLRPFQYGHYLDPALISDDTRWWQPHKSQFVKQWRAKRLENSPALRKEAMGYFERCLGLPTEKIQAIDHHQSHMYSALPNVVAWGRSLIFSLDGSGDWMCSTVSLVENGRATEIARTPHENSIGFFYAETTALLGMKAGEHEFKVMGLAPYAKSEYYEPILKHLRELLTVTDDGRWIAHVSPNKLRRKLEQVYRYQRFDNVAGAIQALTEELTQKWIRAWIRRTGCNDVALTGGVFMNVKACQRIAEMPDINRIFVVPSAADESCAIGSAVWGSMHNEPDVTVQPLKDLYLGRDYSEAEVEMALVQAAAEDRYVVHRPRDINIAAAELLAENQIVARCVGRMEFGARALGNRSILANPSRFENLQFINDAIKSRDFWMPFTPSILAEDMDRYIQGADKIFPPYMCITFDSTPAARKDIVAAIHPRDFTARPQCVLPDWNPGYHSLISHFKAKTGIGAVLNTSFNLHGEPNVCSPQDAIRTIDLSGLRYLVLGHVLLEKRTDAGDQLDFK